MNDDRDDTSTDVGAPTWNEYVETELDALMASYRCLRCRLNRRVMEALSTLERLIRHNAAEGVVEAMEHSIREFNADARGAWHDCGHPNGP